MSTHPVRLAYEAAVGALAEEAARRLASGLSEEQVGRWIVAERNGLKQRFRDLTPPPVVARIGANTHQRYGNAVGPDADTLRAAGKSWREIIASAARPGRHGGSFFDPA